MAGITNTITYQDITEAGLICMTKVLAKLAGSSGLTVNNVFPGITTPA